MSRQASRQRPPLPTKSMMERKVSDIELQRSTISNLDSHALKTEVQPSVTSSIATPLMSESLPSEAPSVRH